MALSTYHAECAREDLDAVHDNIDLLATLLGDLSRLEDPMPGSLIAAQRFAESIRDNLGQSVATFRRRAGLPVVSDGSATRNPVFDLDTVN